MDQDSAQGPRIKLNFILLTNGAIGHQIGLGPRPSQQNKSGSPPQAQAELRQPHTGNWEADAANALVIRPALKGVY